MARIVIHIGRLILRGVPPGDRGALQQGLREELAQAFAPPQMARHWALAGHRETVRGRIPYADEPALLGAEAARHIAKGSGV